MNVIYPVMTTTSAIFLKFSAPLVHKYGARKSIFVIGFFLFANQLISSFVSNFWLFFVFYGIGFGISNGLIYLIPLNICCHYFKENKGLVTGILKINFFID